MDNWIVILEFSCVLAAALAIYANYRRTKKTMDTIDQMLDAAVEGTYSETNLMKAAYRLWKPNLPTIYPPPLFPPGM